MTRRTLKLAVVKTDGTTEEYIHTKVVGAIANALGAAGQPDIAAAEELAEAVTFFLYRSVERRSVSSGEILSIIKMVLAGTGYEGAAVALSEHHFDRRLKRCRVEVTTGQPYELRDARGLYKESQNHTRSRWDKSRIVENLVGRHGFGRQTARTVASMVEEKVLNIGLPVVPADLIGQLVLSDAAAILHAQQQLQPT